MRKTRIAAALLSMCLLTGCTQIPEDTTENPTDDIPVEDEYIETEQETPEQTDQYVFTRESFPRMDGSTSTVPLGQAIASVLLGETRDEVSDLIQFNKTTESYRYLMWDEADILIAAEPANIIWEEKENNGFEWEMEPFAVDGLVFVVNEDNPVDSLTIEQVQKIYSGEITNWSEVGGNDLDIVPFQRNEEAGSQTAMLKHVMKDVPIMEAPTEQIVATMMGLLEVVAEYDNTPAAIGYTMYYYAEDMKMADGLKIIAIDGVEPNDDTIRSGKYPFLNNYYVLTAAGLSEDAPAKIMFDWLLSKDGQKLVAHEGYVPVMDIENAEDGTSPVYADWSKLTPYESITEKYTYFEPRSEDGYLQPREDYGVLLPYNGRIINTFDKGVVLQGLVTAEGRIVTEPVYRGIYFEGKFMLLEKSIVETSFSEEWNNTSDSFIDNYTIAAPDGSWVRDVGLCVSAISINDKYLVLIKENGEIITLNNDGDIVSEIPASVLQGFYNRDIFNTELDLDIRSDGNGCYVFESYDYENDSYDALCVDVIEGKVSEIPEWYTPGEYYYDEEEDEEISFPGYDRIARITDPVTSESYYVARVSGSYRDDLLDLDGNLLYEDLYREQVINGLISHIQGDYFCYYSLETGEMVFCYLVHNDAD